MPVMREYPPGTPCWVDLSTSEPAAAVAFYSGLFGWESYTAPGGGEASYTFFAPVNFAVTDCDAAVALAGDLGGEVAVPPADAPPGRLAVIADPQGAPFTIIKLAADPASH